MRLRKLFLISIVLISVSLAVNFDYVLLQKINADFLKDINQSSRVIPHRVNSIGKLRDIWNDGIRSFEVDIYLHNKVDGFQVGHDREAMSGASLEDIFLSISYENIEKIWLDLKNLNSDNHLEIFQRLEYLDSKYNIKDKVLLESGATLPFFKKMSINGWRTSYYLPTSSIKKFLEDGDVIQMKKLALKIARQSEAQNLAAVSFDYRLYPFTKTYLEPLIPKSVEYHSWWGPSLKKYTFRSKLLKNELFLDRRIKTILVKYKSRHHI